jgi:hypothetical protein
MKYLEAVKEKQPEHHPRSIIDEHGDNLGIERSAILQLRIDIDAHISRA